MSLVSGPTPPLWLKITIVAIFAWPFLLALTRQRSDLRIFAIGPHLLSTTGAALGFLHITYAMQITGFAPHATAATLAEAFIVPITGCAISALLSLFILVWRGAHEGVRRHVAIAPFVVAAAYASHIAIAATGISMYSHPIYSDRLLFVIRTLICFNTAMLLVAVVTTFTPGRLQDTRHDRWFVGIAVTSALLAAALCVFVKPTILP